MSLTLCPSRPLLIYPALASATAAATVVAANDTAAAANGADAAAAVANATVDASANAAAAAAEATATQAAAVNNGAAAADNGAAAGAAATGADFGACDPTIKFEGGLGGRPGILPNFIHCDVPLTKMQQPSSRSSLKIPT